MSSVNHPLLEITDDDVKKAWKTYNVESEADVRFALAVIKEWCQKQDHLIEAVNQLDHNSLERLWLLARGSIEMTKNRIEKLFTIRGMMPELYSNISIDEFDDMTWISYAPLPKLNPSDQSRVIIAQPTTRNIDEFNLLVCFRYAFLIGDYRLHYDYSLGDRFVVDLKNAPISILTKFNPILLKKCEFLCTQGYGAKIKGIHILNAPSFVDKFVYIMKQGLKGKVASRVHVHNTFEDLHKEIAKEILPKAYGGDGPNCDELSEQWRAALKTEEGRKIIAINSKLVSDESKRSNVRFNDEYLGMPGSFRRLAVD